MIDKTKFENHVLHWLATKRVSEIAKKHKKTELYQRLKKVRLESAREDLLDLRDRRDLRDLRDRRDLRDLRDIRLKEFLAAYTYADGNLKDLKDKHLYSHILALVTNFPGNELKQDAWHTCQTAHCEAGWTVENMGAPARELEEFLPTPIVAAMISFASTRDVPNYYELDNTKALEDIRMRASKE